MYNYFRIILIQEGIRITKYESQIYQIISASYDHLTAEQVYDALRKIYPAVSRATIYNNLHKLCEANLIRKISVEGLADRYDRIARHDHLVCQRCGKLADITFEDLTAPLRRQLGEDFLYYDLKVFYLCPDCRKKDSSG